MLVKRRIAFVILIVLSLGLSMSMAQAADSKKTLAEKAATSACKQFTLSMTINDSFLNLSKTAQTKAKMDDAIASERRALTNALTAFKSAAKQDKKWKTIADSLDIVIHTDKADAYTKSFSAVLGSCNALKTPQKK
jgi:outer membrane protein TolC